MCWWQPARKKRSPMTSNNQPGPSQSEWGTQEFPPAPGRPPTQPQNNRAVPWLLLVIILLLVAIIIGAFGWSQGWFGDRGSNITGDSTQPVTSTVMVTEIPEPVEPPPAAPAPPAAPVLPPAAVPVEQAPISGQSSRAFTEVHRGNENTSEAFARNVGMAFRNHFSATGQTSPELSVYSPVTDLYYSMSCQDNGTFVTCTGGNNAVVYLL